MSASGKRQIGTEDGVAVIGLGKMGLPMARNLHTAGYRVVGYDVGAEACERARGLGIEIASSPRDAAERTAAGLVVVGFDDQAREVVAAPETGLIARATPGYLVAMCSTIESATSTDLAGESAARGHTLIDTTLCLGEPAAEDGTLLIMCGGDGDALDALDPVLNVIGADVYRLGGAGAGQIGKMLNNFLLWNCVVANHEAMRLGGRLGLDLEALRQALMLSSGNNWALETWLRSRPMPWAEKDMKIVMQHADEAGLAMPCAELVRQEITDIKVVKNGWTEGGAAKSSMDAFTRAHL